MATYKRTINKFNRGEVDERFLGRDDVERVVDTSARMENLLPIRLGPMQYRPGSEFLGSLYSAANTVLIPFLAPNDNSVVLELAQTSANPSVEVLRVWQDGALVTCTATANTITNGTFASNITGWTDGSDGGATAAWSSDGTAKLTGNGTSGYGRLSQALTVTAAAKRTLMITIADGEVETLLGYSGADSAEIFSGTLAKGVHALTFTPSGTTVTLTFRNRKAYSVKVDTVAYASAGALALSGSFFPDTSTTAAAIKTLQYTQSADVVYITSDGYRLTQRANPLVRVERRGDESWSMTIPEFQDGPFGAINDTAITLHPSAVSGDISVTASLPLFVDSTKWVGRSYKLVHGATSGVIVITSVTNSTTAAARVTVTLGGTTATEDWYPGLFAHYLPGPTAVALFDGRLWLAGDGRVWGSVSDAYTSFDEEVEGDSKAISKTIGFGPVQQVNWLSAGPNLVLGTPSAEIRVASNDFGDVITATNCRLPNASNIGSSRIPPERIDGLVYLVQRSGRRIIELSNIAQEGGADFRDLMLLHPDICSAGIRRIALARHPEPRLYCVLEDGTMAVCLLEAAEKVTGWVPVSMEEATVLDVAILPNTDEDEVYVTVQRGSTKYLERFAAFAQAQGGAISQHYDGHVYEASPGTTISNLSHLDGEQVYVWADGVEFGPYTVASGTITVPTNSWTHSVTGRKHTAVWESNRLGQYLPASVLTDRKRIVKVGMIAENIALKTITFGEDGYPLPEGDVASVTPRTTPNVLSSDSPAEPSDLQGTVAVLMTDTHMYTMAGHDSLGAPFVYGANTAGGLRYHYLLEGVISAANTPAAVGLSRPEFTAFDSTGQYQVTTWDSSGGMPGIIAYDWTSGAPVEVPDPSTIFDVDTPTAVAWQPDGLYCAVVGPTSPYLHVFDFTTGTPVRLTNPGTLPTGGGLSLAWSPSGRYLAVGHTNSPYMSIYDTNGGTLTKLSNPGTLPTAAVGDIAWSDDGAYLACGHGSTSPKITVYAVSGTTYTKTSDAATAPAGTVNDVSWRPGTLTLAVAGTSSPFVQWYSLATGTPVKLSDPGTLPPGSITGVAWSPSGTFCVVSGSSTPRVRFYTFASGSPVVIADPATLPGLNRQLEKAAWSSDSVYVLVGHETGGALIVYDMTSGSPVVVTGAPSAIASSPRAAAWRPGGGAASSTFTVYELPALNQVGQIVSNSFDNGAVMVYDYDEQQVMAVIPSTGNIVTIDVADPTTPSIVAASAAVTEAEGTTAAMYVYHAILVASATGTSVSLIEMYTPASPQVYQTITDPLFANIVDFALMYSGYAFAASESGNAIVAIGFEGVTDTLVDATRFSGLLAMKSSGVFLVTLGTTNGFLSVIDASNPTFLELIGSNGPSAALELAVDMSISGDYVYITTSDSKVLIYSIAVPTGPTYVGSFTSATTLGTAPKIKQENGVTYVINTTDGTVTALDFRSAERATYGEFPLDYDGEYTTDSRLTLTLTGPATILAITYEVDDTDNPPAGSQ